PFTDPLFVFFRKHMPIIGQTPNWIATFFSRRRGLPHRVPNLSFIEPPVAPLAKAALLKALHHHSNPLSAADARRSQPVLLLPPPQLIQQSNHQPRPSRTQRMPQRNRPAIHVYFFA